MISSMDGMAETVAEITSGANRSCEHGGKEIRLGRQAVSAE
jgi:hypothetical protein